MDREATVTGHLWIRAAADIPGGKGRVDGRVEVGLWAERWEHPSEFRPQLQQDAERAASYFSSRPVALDEDTACQLADDLNARIAGSCGGRPHWIEIWRGTGGDAEPLLRLEVGRP